MEILLKDKIRKLLDSEAILIIENKIAEHKNCSIYKEDLNIIINLITNELEQSELPFEEVVNFINNNSQKIVEFGVKFLEGLSPKFLSTGIAITYSIYYIYLTKKSDKSLELYIKRRKIPNYKIILNQLKMTMKSVSGL